MYSVYCIVYSVYCIVYTVEEKWENKTDDKCITRFAVVTRYRTKKILYLFFHVATISLIKKQN